MKNEQQTIYGSYTRKSSEAEDRQTLSIDSQRTELNKLAEKSGIEVAAGFEFSESKSAKTAFSRPEFERMIQTVVSGKMQGILTWNANRLSRNAVDAARLIELMDQGKLTEIITPSQAFRNTPQDKFMFSLMCSQAKMENDSKGIDVRRGLRKKNEMGFPGGVAKPGYMNDYGIKGQRKIKADPERFELVKKLFELFLTGNYSVRKLLKYSDDVLGLKTIQRQREGGAPLKLSQLYRMLQDPFFAGFFYGTDENGMQARYDVNDSVPRMITEEQYWQIQSMLGRKGLPRPSKNRETFPYAGRVRCGSCGGTVTAEHKHQLICPQCKHKFAYQNKDRCPVCDTQIREMDGPTYLHYIYYHCTKRKNWDCPEGAVRQEFIDESLAKEAEDNYAVSQALSDWCIRNLDQLEESDRQNEFERKAAWEREKMAKQKEYDELVRMKMRGLIDDDNEFLRIKASLKADLARIDKALQDLNSVDSSNLEEAKKAFRMAVGITETFRTGTYAEKQEALSSLGSNLTLKDKKLSISNKELMAIITKGLLEARAINEAFEPTKCEADKDETDTFVSVRPALLRR